MRNPYITGGWVSGPDHYGREALVAHLLNSPSSAFWVVGNRRMGKTSLLRQLEFTVAQDAHYVPLFWDLQGSSSLEQMAAELLYAVEDEAERFRQLVVDVPLLRNWDAVGMLRLLRRYARAAGKTLLLLCDEAEALLTVAENDPQGLANLRKVMQSGHGLRVVLTSTKLLTRLNDLGQDWKTSPFLFGFAMANLTGLSDEATTALIRHTQDPEPVTAGEDQVREISRITNNHPYLTQLLCNRLFEPSGRLRPVEEQDLALGSLLSSYFRNDYRWLSPGERQVLLAVADGDRAQDEIAQSTGLTPAVMQEFIFGLQRLGQLRRDNGRLDVGNEFLRRWLEQERHSLGRQSSQSEISDSVTRQLVREGQEQEARYLLEQLNVQRANLGELELQRAQVGMLAPLDLLNNIKRVQREIEDLEQRLAMIPATIQDHYRGEPAMAESVR